MQDESIDLVELFDRVRRGLALILGLTLVGLAVAAVISYLTATRQAAVSTLRVTFSFPGVEKGTYPNGSKFQPDDIRAPDVIIEAIKQLGVQDMAPDLSSQIRGAIGISGFVSPNIIKERDRLRAAGQNLPPYFPDEYEVSLSLPRSYPIGIRQRELLLSAIIDAYKLKFRRTYVDLPPEFGNAFSSLRNADFVDYELVLTKELESLKSLLEQRIVDSKQFRSPTNGLSFQDLIKQVDLFTQIRLNDVLGPIYSNGLTKDRQHALLKMDYYIRTLEDKEQRREQEQSVVTGLLAQTQNRAQNYVLATKAQAPQGAQPMLDQGFIDALLANDAYNFLVRQALDAGLAVTHIQADIAQLQLRRQRLESFANVKNQDQEILMKSTQAALSDLEKNYQDLIGEVRVVLEDNSRQEYADAVRVTMAADTGSILTGLIIAAVSGASIGFILGVGISLIRPAMGRATS
jgi:hypothetical protein